MADLSNKKVAVLVDNYFEEAEFTGPIKALKDQGAQVDVIGVESRDLQGMNHDTDKADTFRADYMIDDMDDARMEDYDALIMPGGTVNADRLRTNQQALSIVRKFLEAGKPLAAICHAPWVLVSAGIAQGRKLTSYNTLKEDLQNAGAEWVDQEVVVDHNLITSRNPDDIPAFSNAISAQLAAA